MCHFKVENRLLFYGELIGGYLEGNPPRQDEVF